MKHLKDLANDMPEAVTIKLDNASVLVAEITLKPGETLPTHVDGKRVIYSINDYTIEFSEGDTSNQIGWNAGDVHWHGEGAEHSIQNIGDSIAQFLVVIIKEQ